MADSTNSSRRLLKATYVPARVPAPTTPGGTGDIPPRPSDPPNPTTPSNPNVMKKIAFLRGLNFRPAELAALRGPGRGAALAGDGDGSVADPSSLIDLVEQVSTNLSPALIASHGALLARLGADDLAAVARQLLAVRREAATLIRG
eukprot:gene55220-75660_t